MKAKPLALKGTYFGNIDYSSQTWARIYFIIILLKKTIKNPFSLPISSFHNWVGPVRIQDVVGELELVATTYILQHKIQ